jgi:hypothetical protein
LSTPPTTIYQAELDPQTGMPPNVVTKSKEIIYDALELNVRFAKNPFGPLELDLSRPEHHW